MDKKTKHGGKRQGAGRKTTIGASVRMTVSLTPDDVAKLKAISSNRSKAVRILIRRACK